MIFRLHKDCRRDGILTAEFALKTLQQHKSVIIVDCMRASAKVNNHFFIVCSSHKGMESCFCLRIIKKKGHCNFYLTICNSEFISLVRIARNNLRIVKCEHNSENKSQNCEVNRRYLFINYFFIY